MDYQNAEFYKLNKNNPDLVYIFADETITYKKEEVDGKLTIVEYRKMMERKALSAELYPPMRCLNIAPQLNTLVAFG